MEQVSNRLAALSASQTLAMTQKARELKAKGVDVIDLSVGEPDFNTPDYVKEAAKTAIDANYSFYSPVAGFPELLTAISNKLKTENKLDYQPKNILVSNGAKQSITNLMLALLNPGDEIIIPTPYWVSYPEAAKLAEAVPVYVKTSIDTDFKMTPSQLAAAIGPKTRMLVFSSPSNPSGTVYSKTELAALAGVLSSHPQIIIVSDEIYEHINFVGAHESIAQFPDIASRTVVVNGVSKGYAMTGWRIGYIAAPEWIAQAVNKLQSQYTSGACSIAQKAAEAALKGGLAYPHEMAKAFRRRRDMMVQKLSAVPGIKTNTPQGAFYIFPDVSSFFGKEYNGIKIGSSFDLCLYLLNQAHVALVSGDSFGQPECLRFSYATADAVLEEACKRVAEALALLE